LYGLRWAAVVGDDGVCVVGDEAGIAPEDSLDSEWAGGEPPGEAAFESGEDFGSRGDRLRVSYDIEGGDAAGSGAEYGCAAVGAGAGFRVVGAGCDLFGEPRGERWGVGHRAAPVGSSVAVPLMELLFSQVSLGGSSISAVSASF
jgi:hypothetical protein